MKKIKPGDLLFTFQRRNDSSEDGLPLLLPTLWKTPELEEWVVFPPNVPVLVLEVLEDEHGPYFKVLTHLRVGYIAFNDVMKIK